MIRHANHHLELHKYFLPVWILVEKAEIVYWHWLEGTHVVEFAISIATVAAVKIGHAKYRARKMRIEMNSCVAGQQCE